MQFLSRGQKMKLADLSPSLQWQVGIAAQAPGLTFDISCFGVDAEGQLSDDRYFIFFNQPDSPEGALQLKGAQGGDDALFEVDLARLPATVRRMVFVVTIDGSGTMAQLTRGHVRFMVGSEVARFDFNGADFATEKAIMAAEIYFKDVWRVAAIGQGFAGGLGAVLKHFGGEEIEEEAAPPPSAPPPSAPPPSAPPPTKAAPPAPPQVVSLQKPDSSFKINLAKEPGEIVATATWIDNGDAFSDNDDLDLRAGILFPDGSMSIVTCTKPGSLSRRPFVLHEGDVQSASVQQPGQETMRVNAQIGEKIGGDIAIVFSIYSAIGNGAVSIASLQPKMKLQYGSQIIECSLDFSRDKAAQHDGVYTYVIGLVIIRNGQIEISPGGQVSAPGDEWTPWLRWDGKGGVLVTIDGPTVFKEDDEFSDEESFDEFGRRYI